MAPAKGSKGQGDVNPWGWVFKTRPEEVKLEHMLKAYRVVDYKRCEETRRNCRKNPYCYWGLGEKKWIHEDSDDADENDSEFREEGEFAGLQNLGATCYVNSLLQLWFHNPILRPAILQWQPSRGIEDAENYRPKCAIAQLQAMFARMKVSKRSSPRNAVPTEVLTSASAYSVNNFTMTSMNNLENSCASCCSPVSNFKEVTNSVGSILLKIDPTEFVTSLKLDTGEQQDAQEFSKLFMEVIVKLLTEYADADVRTSVGTAFRGELQNETECMGCKNKTQRQESFSELELGVRKNLGESLDELLKDELLSGSEQYFCSVCQKKNDAIRRTHLLKLPPVMNLQLMRFVFDRETYRKKKVTTNIQFPEELDMTSRLHGNKGKENPEKLVYQLSAVLVHNGPSASSGHYVAQIKDLRTGAWHKFNDETVDLVAKAKSQKLVLKEDEGSESDSEKKGKAKKQKSGIHNSQGAYMLVYTLDHYVKNPEPDPVLWPYLEKLVKTEDFSYEEEIKKSKVDKDYELNFKEQRRSQVSMLYKVDLKTKKAEPSLTEDEKENDDEDFQPPKTKICRTEVTNGCATPTSSSIPRKGSATFAITNKVSLEIVPSPTKIVNGNNLSLTPSSTMEIEETESNLSTTFTTPKTNGEVNTPNGAHLQPKVDLDVDFISSDWLQQWLDFTQPLNPVPLVDNGMLRCEHDKLAPPPPNTATGQVPVPACLYKIVPSDFADKLYECYNSDGPRFKGIESLCEVCVQKECRRLRSLSELEEDSKLLVDLCKKMDSRIQSLTKNSSTTPSQEFKDSVLSRCCWIGKGSFKKWKGVAKRRIEECYGGRPIKSDTQNDGAETPDIIICEESDESAWPLNAEIQCPHDNLDPDESGRKLITFEAWSIIGKYFTDAVLIAAEESSPCSECLNQKEANTVMAKKNKELAANQKSNLADIYNLRNRPDVDEIGTIFVIPLTFVQQWKKFVRDPTRHQPVKKLENTQLLCKHEKFMYPLMYLSDLFPASADVTPDQEVLCLVHQAEWNYIKENFPFDIEISIQIHIPLSKDGLEYHPEVCNECATEWWMEEYKKKFQYENEQISVIRRDKDNQDNVTDDDDDDLFTPVVVKRDKIKNNPNGWKENPPWVTKEKETPKEGIRRSNRPRRQKGEKTYKVSSSLTLKDLKVMILRDFKAMPSDQHIFHNNEELRDSSATLGQLEILPGSTIYLEVDTATKAEDEPVSLIPETGFQGTLLMGDGANYDFHVPEDEETQPSTLPSCD